MYVVDNCIFVLGEQSISPELLEAFDTMLSALANHSQAGKEVVEKAGGIVLTRLKSVVISSSGCTALLLLSALLT